MAKFTVNALVSVMVAIEIDAENSGDALAIFKDNIAMTASLPDIPEEKYSVTDDAIEDIDSVFVKNL